MTIEPTLLKDCFIIQPSIFMDERGYFMESFQQKKFTDATGIITPFVQDNESKSTYGVLRGLHFQTGTWAQAKLVRVTEGCILDVAVDMRKESPTYKRHIAIELSAKNKKQLYVPRGFAHGFIVLSKEAIFLYKCDNYYYKAAEKGIRYNDPALSIQWPIPLKDIIVSHKDSLYPFLETTN